MSTITEGFEIYLQASAITPMLLAGKKGATHSKPRKLNPSKSAVQLTQAQRDAVVGTMLGDSSMERAKSTHNARLRFEQTFPTHASYLTHLYILFMSMYGQHPRVMIRSADKRTGKIYSTLAVKRQVFPCLNYFFDLFYVNGVKCIPVNIGEFLTPRALAYWIMDDGGKGVS